MKLELEQLAAGYKSKVILDEVGMTLESGAIQYLIGANGSGKSTLLKTIAGHLPSLGGTIKLNAVVKSADDLKTQVVYLAGRNTLSPRIRVDDMILTIYSKRWKDRVALKANLLEDKTYQLLDIISLLPKRIDRLSDGQTQKVLLAIALLKDCPIILLDEPFNFLDPLAAQSLHKILERIATQRILFISTHDLKSIEKAPDCIFACIAGKVVQVSDNQSLTTVYG